LVAIQPVISSFKSSVEESSIDVIMVQLMKEFFKMTLLRSSMTEGIKDEQIKTAFNVFGIGNV